MKRLLTIGIVMLFAFFANAQDIHFSQHSRSPLGLNPANTGSFTGDFRVGGHFRNQWVTVPVNYNTASIFGDMAIVESPNGHKLGGGLVLFYDRAGDSKLSSVQIYPSIAYHLGLGKDRAHQVSVGVSAGFGNRRFGLDDLQFDNQYNGDSYDPDIPISESFDRLSYSYFDAGAGIGYTFQPDMRNHVKVGLGVFHLNRPNQSFFDNAASVELNERWSSYASFQVKTSRRLDLKFDGLYQRQDTKQESLYGVTFKTYLGDLGSFDRIVFNNGIHYRTGDAIIISTGIDYNNWSGMISYDINTSGFRKATNTYGGIEASLIYIMYKKTNITVDGSYCPVF